MLLPAVQAFRRTISCIFPAPVLSSQREPEVRAGAHSKAPGAPDPKLNTEGVQQVGDIRFSATERSGAERQNITPL